jgi:putative methyltransferase (TIGR04325 family)
MELDPDAPHRWHRPPRRPGEQPTLNPSPFTRLFGLERMKLIETIRRLPGIWHLRKYRFERRFSRMQAGNLHHGVFGSFEAASASAPRTRPLGYDNNASAALYDDDQRTSLKDYPAVHWLADALHSGYRKVFDLGGHVGIKYYAFREQIRMPSDLLWTVSDVPAVVRRGAALAAERGVQATLRFTSEPSELGAHEVLFASGCVQYLPRPLAELLASLPRRPARIVVNTAALHPTRTFYTLNAIGTSFCPYFVQREAEFVSGLDALGYRLVDRWLTPKHFRLPFDPGHDLDHFVGMALELRSTAAG